MEAYLKENNIEYTKDKDDMVLILPNFKYFTVYKKEIYNEYLFGKNDKFNNLLKNIKHHGYMYNILLFGCRIVCCSVRIGKLRIIVNAHVDFNFDLINDSYNYIINNLQFSEIKYNFTTPNCVVDIKIMK